MPHWNLLVERCPHRLLVEQGPIVYWWNDVLIVSNSAGVFIRGDKRSFYMGS
jgi:hypothetical protein